MRPRSYTADGVSRRDAVNAREDGRVSPRRVRIGRFVMDRPILRQAEEPLVFALIHALLAVVLEGR